MLNTATDGSTYSTMDIDICIIDRLLSTYQTVKNVYCVYDDFSSAAGFDSSFTINGNRNQYKKSFRQQILTFNPESPPSPSFAARLIQDRSGLTTPISNYERINNISTTTPLVTTLPGAVRLLPVAGKPGHYATNTNTSGSGVYTIKVPIRYSSNGFPEIGANSGSTNVYEAPWHFTNNSIFRNRLIRFQFFEINPVTGVTTYIGYKVIRIDMSRNSITSKYYAQSRANFGSTIIGTNPMGL
jgi:hypothetical protein